MWKGLDMIRQISHIGIATNNLERARDFYSSIFKLESPPPLVEGDLKVSMVQIGNIKIELMEPLGNEGVIAKFLEKRGEGIHHICFEVDDIGSALEFLAAKGSELVDTRPRPGAEGKIAFLHPRAAQGVLIELVQVEKETRESQ